MLLKARFVFRAAQTRVLLVILLWPGAALAAYTCAAAGFMWREAAKRWGGDGPPVEGGWQTFGVWVVQGWFAWNELCVWVEV